ncbi:hypothetical protein CBR_g38716 [Chara braunii]|uniref:ABC transmembrane type-1 domain-containing protein n=1 Tax=Chara braunii TaxID=69332 RepID=A0A388LQ87_CHABU|nr:hypothetical protein CBR_g38716 [Chara braunii]|eukprot:GBG84431.1 hypothetical protein CBR_g38716 [Chara braunii]
MVETRSGLDTSPYTKEQQEKVAALVKENRERKEREKQAKLKAIADEQVAKMKGIEEEMEKKKKAVEEEAAVEEEKERMRIESREGSSDTKRDTDAEIEKKISEWLLIYRWEKMRRRSPMADPMERRGREDEQKLQWKLRMKREKRRRREEVNKMTAAVAQVQECRKEVLAQPDDKAKWDKILGYLDVLSKAWMEERQASWSQDVALSAMRSAFKEFAREIVTHIGGEVKQLRDNVGKSCEGTIEGAKAIAAVEGDAKPRKDPVKLKFPDAYGGKKEENFDNWEASVNSYIYLQHILTDEKVLVAFQALKDEAASFARSLARAAGCENNLVAYSKVTPLPQFLKLLKERFADPTRGIRASDKLQSIHSRQWRSARALKGTMDDLVAVPDHGVTETQLVQLFYRAIPEALRGHFFDKSQQAGIMCRVGALIDSGATRSYISRRALKKLKLGLKVQKLADPIVSVLADNRTMRIEDYVEGVQAYFRLEKDGKVDKVLHSLTLLVQDDLPFDVVLGMDWGEAAGATLHLREHECRLPNPSSEFKTARLFHVSGVDNTLAHCCLSAPVFARLVKKERLEEQVFVVYVRPITEAKEEVTSTDPTIAKLLEEFKDLTESPTGVVSRPIQHRIEPGSRTPKGAVYRMSPRELEELCKQLDELLEKGWIRPNSSPFGAPVLFVPKKEGELRMCIDYRGLNAITVKTIFLIGCRVVLEKLRESNFKINAKKCEWAKTQVLYLDHVLDGDGIKPEDSKIAAIRDWPTPRTLTELRSFLGLANYYRKFVRNFSTIAAPLRRLLKKEAIWQWDKDCTSALKKLKRALIEYPVLKVADPSLPFVVTTDASQYGIGAVLQQDDDKGYRPVEFMSARMPLEKVATSAYERELYALRQALEHWKHYLLGRHFKVLVSSVTSFELGGFLRFTSTCVMFSGPLLLHRFIEHAGGAKYFEFEGYALVLALFLSKVLEALCDHHFNFHCALLGMHVRSALAAVVYHKGLRLSNVSRQSYTIGELVNYMAVDAQRLADLMGQLHGLWILPFQIVIAVCILFKVVGISMLAGIGVMITFMAINFFIARRQRAFQVGLMMSKDSRMRAMNESLNNMKVIKFHAWEDFFRQKIEDLRAVEAGWLSKYLYMTAWIIFLFWLSPLGTAVATFGVCVVSKTHLSTARAFTAIATLRILQDPLRRFPEVGYLCKVSFYSFGQSLDAIYCFMANSCPFVRSWHPIMHQM